MSSSHGSTKVILTAFAANLGISIAKLAGAFYSGSASMLAEAVHSFVDSSNQVLLLIGHKKSLKAPDKIHPLGYGREAFFWSFIVAILLFSLGGLFAIYEGAHKLEDRGEVKAPIVSLVILVLSLCLEGYSFRVCLQEVRAKNQYGSLWNWFKNTKSSELLVIFTEDAAALAGLSIATLCLSLAWGTGQIFWDAVGSILVGIILVVVAILLAIEVKSFIIGESSGNEIEVFVLEQVEKFFPSGKMFHFIAIQTGSDEVMLSCKIHPGNITDLDHAISLVNQLEKAVKTQFSSVRWSFVELDKED